MFHFQRRVIAILALFALIMVPTLNADTKADLQEVHKFQLTEKKLDQFAQAIRNMAAAVEKNPELAKEDDDSSDANASIDQMVAKFNSHPVLRQTVESTGMTSREFVLFQMALMSAAMGHYVVEQGQKLPPEISPEHVAFYKAHQAKFEALQKEWEVLDKKMNAAENEEEQSE